MRIKFCFWVETDDLEVYLSNYCKTLWACRAAILAFLCDTFKTKPRCDLKVQFTFLDTQCSKIFIYNLMHERWFFFSPFVSCGLSPDILQVRSGKFRLVCWVSKKTKTKKKRTTYIQNSITFLTHLRHHPQSTPFYLPWHQSKLHNFPQAPQHVIPHLAKGCSETSHRWTGAI